MAELAVPGWPAGDFADAPILRQNCARGCRAGLRCGNRECAVRRHFRRSAAAPARSVPGGRQQFPTPAPPPQRLLRLWPRPVAPSAPLGRNSVTPAAAAAGGSAAVEPGAAPASQPLPGLPPGQRHRATKPPEPLPDEAYAEPHTPKVANTSALFTGLDKITGRIINFDVAIGETVQFGALQLTPRACYTRPPTELPNTDAFVEVDEVTLQGEVRRIFTGWMFAASPGLHGVEHPIYDLWLTDCKGPARPRLPRSRPTAPPGRPPQRAPARAPPKATAAAARPAPDGAGFPDSAVNPRVEPGESCAPGTGRFVPSAPKSPSPASAPSSSLWYCRRGTSTAPKVFR